MPAEPRVDEAGRVRHEHSSIAGEEVLDLPSIRPNLDVEDRFGLPCVVDRDNHVPRQVAIDETIQRLHAGRRCPGCVERRPESLEGPTSDRNAPRSVLDVAEIARVAEARAFREFDLCAACRLPELDEEAIGDWSRCEQLVLVVRCVHLPRRQGVAATRAAAAPRTTTEPGEKDLEVANEAARRGPHRGPASLEGAVTIDDALDERLDERRRPTEDDRRNALRRGLSTRAEPIQER